MSSGWKVLKCKSKELQLIGTLNGGQSFRWKNSVIDNKENWIGVFASKVWFLQQEEDRLLYKSYSLIKDEDTEDDAKLLHNYFQLDLNLEEYYEKWSLADPNFKKVSQQFHGIRILKQNPVENIFSFICSSNNHISRISNMVENLAKFYGNLICEVDGIKYYDFPSVQTLSEEGVEEKLRKNGFGYRAKYVNNSAKLIMKSGGDVWLEGLKTLPYEDAKLELMTLTGVGAKCTWETWQQRGSIHNFTTYKATNFSSLSFASQSSSCVLIKKNRINKRICGKMMDTINPYETMHGSDWMSAPHSTGTSIMAVEFDGGVVIGADSRTTTGAYIANRVTDKLTKVTDNIYCCRSGSAADTQAIADIVSYHLNFHSMELGELPTVKTGAQLFRELCYNYRDSLMAGILVAGWDKKLGGQVYSVPIGGMCVRQPVSIGGSGSSFIYGYVDANFKPNMKQEECVDFVRNSLSLAMARDGSSGGVVRIGIITEKGVERRVTLGTELPKFFEG